MSRGIILCDMDGVLSDWDHGWDAAVDALGPRGEGMIRSADRKIFNLYHGLDAARKLLVDEITQTPGFYRNLPLLPGAKQALKEMLDAGYEVRIVTSPWVSNPTCASDKMAWVVEHLGSHWAQRLIITNDKTFVRGDFLFDDKPEVKGSLKPTWEHILVDSPLNLETKNRRRVRSLANWREAVEPNLDPKPFYVMEADEQNLGPESEAGRYTYLQGTYEDEWGRESTVSALAEFHPRQGYSQDRMAYRLFVHGAGAQQ